MTVEQLIAAAYARLAYLTHLRVTAERHGDVGQMTLLDEEAAVTQATLNTLEALIES